MFTIISSCFIPQHHDVSRRNRDHACQTKAWRNICLVIPKSPLIWITISAAALWESCKFMLELCLMIVPLANVFSSLLDFFILSMHNCIQYPRKANYEDYFLPTQRLIVTRISKCLLIRCSIPLVWDSQCIKSSQSAPKKIIVLFVSFKTSQRPRT